MPKSFTRDDDKGLKVVNADLKAWADASAQQIDDSEVRASFAEVKAAVESAAKEPAPDERARGHVMSTQERERLWWAVTLELEDWDECDAIEPDQAAMVLCGFNPHETSLEDALVSRRPDFPDDALSRMLRHFRAKHQEHRTLRKWLQVAKLQATKQRPLPVHPGVAEYLELPHESKDTPKQSKEKRDLEWYGIELKEAERLERLGVKKKNGTVRGANAEAIRIVMGKYGVNIDAAKRGLRRGKKLFKDGAMTKDSPSVEQAGVFGQTGFPRVQYKKGT